MLALAILAALTLFLSAAAVVLLWSSRSTTTDRLMEIVGSAGTVDEKAGPRVREAAGSIAGLLKPITGILGGDQEDLARRLALAGYRQETAKDILLAAKLLLPLLLIIAVTFSGVEDPLLYILMAGALGFFGPELWLGYAIRKRREKVSQGLADAIDLLVICMEAGLGMDQALMRVGRELRISHPELSDEVGIITREQRAGKPRVEAWRSLAERMDLDTIRQLVSMLVQTERFGTPIARSLGQFADSLRQQRMQAAEEAAAKTTVKMIFPLVLFIFPSMFVVLLGPAIISIMRNMANAFN
jgi:tight adherence protein C